MEIQSAEYKGSFVKKEDCPPPMLPEYAFIGRSNVGKSSLINMLCARKGLAHVSNTPGKTQTLNFYLINENWHLVDLPGYGYAKANRKTRKGFAHIITEYLTTRPNLACTFVLIDAYVPPQNLDQEFVNWLGECQIPFVLTYTKTDRLSNTQLNNSLAVIRGKLLESWNELPQEFITSAIRRTGREEVLKFIGQVNKSC
ncbi:MAG: YihA family ribosome biogenesis GTP-binding protein [Bacteroidetes bacterium]|nr:YihA family ribosome biogenesis GTP-binding protein [Bacteroidota bacterium]